MLSEGADVGVMVTEGVMEILDWLRPCIIWLRDETPVVSVAPPGKDCLGSGKQDVDCSCKLGCLDEQFSTEKYYELINNFIFTTKKSDQSYLVIDVLLFVL